MHHFIDIHHGFKHYVLVSAVERFMNRKRYEKMQEVPRTEALLFIEQWYRADSENKIALKHLFNAASLDDISPHADDAHTLRMILSAVDNLNQPYLVLLRKPGPLRSAVPLVPREEASEGSSEETKTWVAIQTFDPAGQPYAEVDFEVTLPDGSTQSGTTDKEGKARVDGISLAGGCFVEFPKMKRELKVQRK